MLAELAHIWILACIMYVMTSGFRIYLKLRGTADFSYLALVIFGTYSIAILLNHGFGFVASFCLSFILAMCFCFLLLRIITRLSTIYFNIGTFALYILISYIAANLDITKGAFGMSITSMLNDTNTTLMIYTLLAVFVMFGITYFRKTILYTMLAGWGEFRTATKSLGIRETFPVLCLITITTSMALISGTMYLEYYSYVSPSTFWIGFLVTLMATTYGSYIFGELMTFVTTFVIWYMYEMFRFLKFVDVSKIGYLRELLFSLMVMIIVFFVFRRLSFSREQ